MAPKRRYGVTSKYIDIAGVLASDTTAPTVEITSEAAATVYEAFSVTFTFSEDVTGFAAGDITVGNGSAGNFATTSASVYTADITPTATGAVTVDVGAGVCVDGAGNANEAATQLSRTYGLTDTFTRADGDLAGDWTYTAGKWTIASGAALGTPGVTETLLNPGFEGTYAAGLAPNWNKYGTPTTVAEETTIVHGGSSSQKVIADASKEGVNYKVTGGTIGQLIRASSYFYGVDTRGRIDRGSNSLEVRTLTCPATYNQWLPLHGAYLIVADPSTDMGVYFYTNTAGTLYIDDASQARLTMADLYALIPGAATITLKATLHGLAVGSNYDLVGVALRCDSLTNPQTGVLVYHNGTQIVTSTLTGGLLTVVTAGNVTFVDGASLEVTASGNDIAITYNNVAIRTDTVASYATQTVCGMFSTHPDNSISYFEAAAPG